jgi:hypothetical protein
MGNLAQFGLRYERLQVLFDHLGDGGIRITSFPL